MNIDLLLTLLRETLSSSVTINALSDVTGISIQNIRRDMLNLAENHLVTNINGREVRVLNEQRLNLAIFSLREGADIERVCRALGWREFEDLTALALEQNGYGVKKHFRFKGSNRRYEIDVVGLKEPLILSVECKHWRRSGRAATVNAIRMQVERTKSLAQYVKPIDRLGVAEWREVKLLPLVLTLSDTVLKIFNGVPVVPIFNLNSFLNEMQAYPDKIMFFKAKITEESQ